MAFLSFIGVDFVLSLDKSIFLICYKYIKLTLYYLSSFSFCKKAGLSNNRFAKAWFSCSMRSVSRFRTMRFKDFRPRSPLALWLIFLSALPRETLPRKRMGGRSLINGTDVHFPFEISTSLLRRI